MKLMRLLMLCLVATVLVATVLAASTTAFAQAAQAAQVPQAAQLAPSSPPALSTLFIVTTVLSLIIGFVNQGINTGSIFGIKTVPQAWLPYLTLFVTFGGAFGTSLGSAGVLSGTSVVLALFAGVSALLAAGGGSALQNHMKAHQQASNS